MTIFAYPGLQRLLDDRCSPQNEYRCPVTERLRPIERRILALHREGVDHAEIATRFRKRVDFVERVLSWTDIPRPNVSKSKGGHRPVERRVLDLRSQGLSHEEIGRLFARDARYAERIEDFANLRTELGLA